jgi:hypothetical protein
MDTSIATTLYDFLMSFDLYNFFVFLGNYYFPFGSLFWIIGFVLFLIVDIKTKNMAYGGAVASIFFVIISSIDGLVINAYSLFAMRYMGIIIALICGFFIYKSFKGD